ncbi:hypothetical protein GCM10027072_73340 [Streptomyces bullii]
MRGPRSSTITTPRHPHFYEQARRTAGPNAEATHSTGLSLMEFSAPRVTEVTTLIEWSARHWQSRDRRVGDMPNDLCSP